MGIIRTESFVCDFCGEEVDREHALVGDLVLRKAGARGLGRKVQVALHDDCSGKLTQYASPVRNRQRKATEAA